MEIEVSLPRLEPQRTSADLPGLDRVEIAEIRLSGTPRGAVLLLCSSGGLEIQATELMNALVEHGYESLAVDLAPLRGDRAGQVAAVGALLDVLATRGWEAEQVGVVGYDTGGSAALAAAGSLTLGAAVSLSPHDALAEPVPLVRTPWLGMFGELDPDTPPAAVAELGRRLADSPAFTRVVVYPGVGRDYFRASADAVGHAADFDSWQRVVEWLNVRVVPRPTPYAEIWAQRQQDPSDPSPEGRIR